MIARDLRGNPGGAGGLRSSRILLVAFITFGLLALLYTRSLHRVSPGRHADSHVLTSHARSPLLNKGQAPAGTSANVKNSTLGISGHFVDRTILQFERVFVINLPERYDKLDAFTLASSLTGFTHEVIEGIKGATVVNKTLPSLDHLPKVANPHSLPGASANLGTEGDIAKQYCRLLACPLELCTKVSRTLPSDVPPYLIGVFRIVRERIQTALVLEDDTDWDVSFKDQLAEFATGARYISGTTTTPRSPYGDDWDLLWLGHCSAQQHPLDERRFVIENDESVPPMAHRANFNAVPNLNGLGYDNSTRIVFRANNGVCLYSYALSYRGAQKVLRWQNNVKKFEPIDIGIGYQCRDDANFKCIAVFPQMVDSHKSAGRESRDSDIGTFDPTRIRAKGYTANIVRSTRLNMDNLMNNRMMEVQWDDVPQLTIPRRTRFE
ncbi:MAG: hypothetical protein Q9209_007312 [Squamulea sp. 1 TL-2023]